MGKITKEIELNHLPRKQGRIDWYNSLEYEVPFRYGDIEGILKIDDYDKKHNMLSITYLDKSGYELTTGALTRVALGKLLDVFSYGFTIDLDTHIHNEKVNINIIDRKYSGYNRKYQYRCNNCGYEGWKTEHQIFNLSGCPACEKFPHVVAVGINDITTTAPWMIKYFQGGYEEAKKYTKTSNELFYPICPNCGTLKNKMIPVSTLYNKMSIGCSKCSDGKSIPEKIMFNVLEQLNIIFICELSKKDLEWCEKYRYDFYIPSERIIIETHGVQHYEIQKNRNRMTLEEQKRNDYNKEMRAKNNKIKDYIIIDCRISEIEYIKESILNSKLKEYFDLSKIDWNRCLEFSHNSMVKIVSEYKMINKEMTTTEIAKVFKIHRSTVLSYLKKGNLLGWCEYSPNEEILKRVKRNRNRLK